MKIAIIGPQNTGKSTFISDILSHYPQFTAPEETYRTLIEERGLRVNQETTQESQKLIRDFLLQEMKEMEDNTVLDRSVIDSYVYTYAGFLLGNIPESFVKETWDTMIESLPLVDIYVFIPTALSVPLEADETRDITPSYIDMVNRVFLDTLFTLKETHKIPVKVIAGSRGERLDIFGELFV